MKYTCGQFKKDVISFVTDKKMTVGEYDKLYKKLKRITIKTLEKVVEEFGVLCDELVDLGCIDFDFSLIYDVRFNKNEIKICYWYDEDRDTHSCCYIPLDKFASWIDGDFSELTEKCIAKIKQYANKNIDDCQTTIARMQVQVEESESFLKNVDNMKFKEILDWYNEQYR